MLRQIIVPSKNIKIIKLCIVSPYYELVGNIIYIVSFFLLAFHIISPSKNFSNYQITNLVSQYFEEDKFKAVTTEQDFFDYIDLMVKKLYNYNPNDRIYAFVPFGAIRLKKYSNNPSLCSTLIDYSKTCTDSQCTIETLGNIYQNSKCGYPHGKKVNSQVNQGSSYDTKYKGMIHTYEGKYSHYNLIDKGQNYDFTIDEYTNNLAAIKSFVEDKDAKFIALLFNVYSPVSESYAMVIAGIEMANYFLFPYPVFSCSCYNHVKIHENPYFLTVFIFFCFSVALNIVKLIYEINLKFLFVQHISLFINEAVNLLLIIFLAFLFAEKNEEKFYPENYKSKEYSEHYLNISIRMVLNLVISILYIFMPFRFLSVISWIPKGVVHIINLFSVLVRIIPSIIVLGSVISLLILVFAVMNFCMYNGLFFPMENLFTSLISVFNFNIIDDMNISGELLYDVSDTDYFLLFNVLQIWIILVTFSLMTATTIALFKRSVKLEIKETNNEVMEKIEEIIEMLTLKEIKSDDHFKKMPKQILWLNPSNKSELFNFFSVGNKMIYFKRTQQMISFLKYLFGIKPDMQFKKLNNKFGIILEVTVNKGTIVPEQNDQVELLLHWLSYVGCKIPVGLLFSERLERNARMKISTSYFLLTFIETKEALKSFITKKYFDEDEVIEEKEPEKNPDGYSIHKNTDFMIYPCIIGGNNNRSVQASSDSLLRVDQNDPPKKSFFSSVLKLSPKKKSAKPFPKDNVSINFKEKSQSIVEEENSLISDTQKSVLVTELSNKS